MLGWGEPEKKEAEMGMCNRFAGKRIQNSSLRVLIFSMKGVERSLLQEDKEYGRVFKESGKCLQESPKGLSKGTIVSFLEKWARWKRSEWKPH